MVTNEVSQCESQCDSFSEEELDKEFNNAEAAYDEYLETGKAERRCLRCGGQFIFEDFGTAYRIRCEKERCFQLTSRGI